MLLLTDNLLQQPIAHAKLSTRKDMIFLMNNCFQFLKETLYNGTNLITGNPYGLSPSDARSSFGQDIEEIDRLYALLKFTLERAVPGTIPHAPLEPPHPPKVMAIESTYDQNIPLDAKA